MGETKFCYRCMEKIDMSLHVCPGCGYNDTTPNDPMYIIPGTILHDKYLTGVLLESNGEGATYVGYNIALGTKVMIREYMPVNFCTRVRNKATISVNYNYLAKYKAFMAEYTELNKTLVRLRGNQCIPTVLDMFSENNTTYIIFDYIEGVKLIDYLKDNSGELTWEQVSKMFPPLFTAVGLLHNESVLHRAISPETVYINEKNELKLSGFSISSVRTANTALKAELFKGYAAPEQYSPSSSSHHGMWTDVYGVCALLYRVLTGCMPNDSKERLIKDSLLEPRSLNSAIPQHVSDVIMDGMKLKGSERIQTITELVTRLFEQPSPLRPVKKEPEKQPKILPPVHPTGNTYPGRTAYPENGSNNGSSNNTGNSGDNGDSDIKIVHEQSQPKPEQYKPKNDTRRPADNVQDEITDDGEDDYSYEVVTNTADRLKIPIIIALLLFIILMTIALVILRLVDPAGESSPSALDSSSQVDNIVTDTTESATDEAVKLDTEMPDLVGKFYELTEKKYKDYFTFEAIYEYNDYYETDMIYEQDVEPGEMVAQGSTVRVWVSKGKDSAIIPDYTGLTVSQYENRLKEAGISNYSLIASANDWAAPNTVTMLMIDGSTVNAGDYYSNKNNSKLIVYYCPAEADTPRVEDITEPPTVSPMTEAPTEEITEAPTEYQDYSWDGGGNSWDNGGGTWDDGGNTWDNGGNTWDDGSGSWDNGGWDNSWTGDGGDVSYW
ncbi:MAG: PASTA domain-containing protein [Ruminococcus sp.]|nr:PASTA domain-containing protein [Ruminococcus sp.]